MMTRIYFSEPVLIIDDEPSVLRLLVLCLERIGYRTDTALTGEEGLEKIRTTRYCLIMTDILMPGISGNQVADVLKNGLNAATPVIGMSGTSWLIEKDRFDAVINKPCSIKEIQQMVIRLIRTNQ
ncbi:response regulator [Desulfotignum phosphitoxidans]|jgi:CheY-like chemotaxis protein|uniref:Putative response regulator protein n=1 Tax=Desulfotignum phosphitoxidans DSM 13687 TaxID=1286635 RepID=S0G7J1_9BACT|nr:response regulator [Desulfotignum phosphitoxidans]EMS81182.1 putative response regulator protein [Desulfotignum phosphitoxidans DSM 13687]